MSDVPATSPLVPGDPSEVDGYQVVGRLGEGGQGVVFLATAPTGGRVAIKRLRTGLVDDGAARARLAKEVAAARQVAPFCTARVIDAQLEGPHPHVVSEFIDGPSLQRRVSDDGPLAGAELYRLAVGTATALAAIHQAGVVHRDFKPANVMLAGDGPRVIDFGIARDLTTDTTVTSRVFGTPAYMAPEQVSGERASTATDVFAWASTMVFAATGQAPFDAPHMVAVVHRITSADADLSGVPPALATVVRRCFAKDPADRPTAQQVVQLLLGRPLPNRDLSDPTAVLAEATQVAVSATSRPPAVPVAAGVTVPRRPDQPTPQPVAGEAAWWAQPADQASPPRPTVPGPMTPGAPLPPMPGPRQPTRARPLFVALVVLMFAAAAGAALLLSDWGLGDRREPAGQSTPTPTVSRPVANPVDDGDSTGPGNGDGDSSGPGDGEPAVPSTFAGLWQGVAFQPRGTVRTWTATLVLAKDETGGTFRIRGNGLRCDGTVTVVEADSKRLVLDAPVAGDGCARSGTVTLQRVVRGSLLFTWVDAAASDNRASGLLRLVD
jgi:hypothetical protein